MKRDGFSLVELLVTIAIIAILVALIAAIYARAKGMSRQTTCVANVRQIQMAMANYSDDWQDAYPFPCNEQDPGIWWSGTWRQRLLPYYRSVKLMDCPEPTKAPDTDALGGHDLGHYGMNCMLTHYPYTRALYPLRFGFSYKREITRPSATILLVENKDGDWSGEPASTYYADSGPSGHFWPYHGNGGIWVFCDGHAAWMLDSQTEKDNFYLWRKVKY